MRETHKVVDEAVGLALSFAVEEDLELEDGLGLDDEEIFEQVPLDLEGVVVELGLVVVLEEVDECAEGGVGDELVVGVVLLLVAPLAVDLVALGLVEDHAFEAPEVDVPELLSELLDEGGVFETGGVDDLEGEEAFDGGDGAEVGESLYDLAEVDFPVDRIIDGNSHLVRAVLDYAHDVLLDVLLPPRRLPHAALVPVLHRPLRQRPRPLALLLEPSR